MKEAIECFNELYRELNLSPQILNVYLIRYFPSKFLSIIAKHMKSRKANLVEALECAEYALANPRSDQQFALNACRTVLKEEK